MAGLQRSNETFRRSGSSGLVWEDKNLSGELKPAPGKGGAKESEAAAGRPDRSRSSGHGGYRTGHVPPAADPPSPRVAVCGFCRLFGKAAESNGKAKAKAKSRRR